MRINMTPRPRVQRVKGTEKFAGAEIHAVTVKGDRVTLQTSRGVVTGSAALLPRPLQRQLKLARDTFTFGPHQRTNPSRERDQTYDTDSSVDDLAKPDAHEEDDTSFPEDLPSNHPKDKQLRKQMQHHENREDDKPSSMEDLAEDLTPLDQEGTLTEEAVGAGWLTRSLKQATMPAHKGPLSKEFLKEITDEFKKRKPEKIKGRKQGGGEFDGTYRGAVSAVRFQKLLSFTRKPEAQAAAKVAVAKGFPDAYPVKIWHMRADGAKKQAYVLTNAKDLADESEGYANGAGLVLTKNGFETLKKQSDAK